MRLPAWLSHGLLPAGAALILASVLYPGAVLRGEAFFERDIHIDWYPRLAALARCLREGSLPVWDPSLGFGQPLLADSGTQAGYPPTWLLLLVPAGAAYTVFVLGHLAIAAIGTAGLARTLGSGRAGSLFSALAFLLSGPLQSSLNLWHHFASACWMPWVFQAAARFARSPRLPRAAVLGVLAALQLLAGSPDVCLMTWLPAAGWILLRLLRRRARLRSALAAAGASLAVALLLSAVVWVPALDVLSRAQRRELAPAVRTAWSVPPAGLLRLVMPLDPERVPFVPGHWGRLYGDLRPPLLSSLYLGAALPVLGLAALAWRRVRTRAAWLLAVAAAGLATAMGPHALLYPALAGLAPPLRALRYPSKLMLLVALATALSAGLGLAAVRRGRVGKRVAAALAALIVTVAAFGAGLSLPVARPGTWRLPLLLAVAAATLLAAAGLGRSRASTRAVAAALAALVCADLLAAHRKLNATAAPGLIFAVPTVLQHVDRSRRVYFYNYHSLPGVAESRLGRSGAFLHVAPPAGFDPRVFSMLALRSYLVGPAAGLYGVEGSYDVDLRGLFPAPLRDLTLAVRDLEGSPAHKKLLRMASVGTVVSLHDRGFEDLRLVARIESVFPEAIRVFRVDDPLPRARLVGCARQADDRRALEIVRDPAFDPAREAVLAEGQQAGRCGPAGDSRILERKSDRLRIVVDADRDALLVVADAWDPGWRASVDGQAVALRRANLAFRAVAVPQGRHQVVMVYRPRSVAWGGASSLAGLAGALALGLASRIRRRVGGAESGAGVG